MGDALLRNARLLAEGIDVNLLKQLTGPDATERSAAYLRMKSHLQLYRINISPGIDVELSYLLTRNASGIPQFLCDDADIGDPEEARLGMLYSDAPPSVREIIQNGNPALTGPYKDRWGQFYSAFWPLYDPVDGRWMASVGLDQSVDLWSSRMRSARWFPQLYFVGLYTLIIAIGWGMHIWKHNPHRRAARHRTLWEVGLIFAFGSTTALATAVILHQQQHIRMEENFAMFSEIRSGQIAGALQDIRDRDLQALQGFLTGQEEVTEAEFSGFVPNLSPDALVAAWHWIDRVSADGSPLLRYSVITPFATSVSAILPLEEPHLAQVIAQGFQEGLPVASPVHRSAFHAEPGSLLLKPVFKGQETTPDGFVAALLLWPRILAYREPYQHLLDLNLFELNSEGATPVLQSDTVTPLFANEITWRDVRPVFAFGKVFAIVNQPTAAFLDDFPNHSRNAVFTFCILLTAIIALVIWLSGRSREHLESEIEERTADLRNLFLNSVNAIASHRILLDTDGQPVDYEFLSVNPAFEKITGLSAANVIGRKVTEVIPNISPDLIQRYGRVALQGESDSFEYADPSLHRTYQISAYATGSMNFAVVFEDITEIEKHANEKLLLQQQLTQAQKMESIGRLAGGVAHDFNNTLQVVLGNAELALKFMTMDETLRDNLLEIRDAASRSSQLTRQLLAFARKENVKPVPLNLNEAVSSSLKMLQRLIGEDIQLVWKPDSSLWNVRIDPGQVDQILVNLIVNSRDALPSGGRIRLQTQNLPAHDSSNRPTALPPGDTVMLCVEDSGCGIPENILPMIFEPFVTTKPANQGTGLGLATVYGIVQQNHGHITVHSEIQKGTTFTIYFPRDTAACPVAGPVATPSTAKHSGNILLVEDDPMILQMGIMLLTKLGYTVHSANCGEKAVQIMRARKEPIDLLLTDVIMPGMNGQQLAHELSALQPGLKCLFMSGYTADIIGTHGVLDDGIDFISKPFSMEDLAVKLEEVFHRHDSPPPT
jgi:PAS domain S-box-containing protein